MPEDYHLILASSSPRRYDLLASLGVNFQCQPADIDETVRLSEPPLDYVRRMALEKAAVVTARQASERYAVLAADTSVIIDDEILGKPQGYAHGLSILTQLSGRSHRVITAVCLQTPEGVKQRSVETLVHFIELESWLCEAYLATDEPWDKAGSYAIQGLGGVFVKEIQGSYSNVVGLPLTETWTLLLEHGISMTLSRPPE